MRIETLIQWHGVKLPPKKDGVYLGFFAMRRNGAVIKKVVCPVWYETKLDYWNTINIPNTRGMRLLLWAEMPEPCITDDAILLAANSTPASIWRFNQIYDWMVQRWVNQ